MSLSSTSQNSINLALAERERRRRKTQAATAPIPAPADFIPQLTIEEPQGDESTAYIPFDLWPAQTEALTVVATAPRLIILKARQLGITWLILAYVYWLCLFHPGRTVLFFSKGQLEADELIRRVMGMHRRWTHAHVRLVKQNTSELVWANGSRMISLPATASAGKSFTASVVVLDEFAAMQYAQQVYTAVKPTIDSGGRLIILSTANGEDNPFHQLWKAAESGLNTFTSLFLPWHARPRRDSAWYADVERDALSAAEMRREYPGIPDDAFSPIAADQFLDDMTLWAACYELLPPLDDRTPLVLAADGAVSNDHFALVGTTRHPVRHDDVAVRLIREWIPPAGGKLDFAAIEDEIRAICTLYHVVQLAYDQHELHYMMTRLQNDGVVWTDAFSQMQDRLIADKQLYDLIVYRRLAHDGDERLTQAIKNADREIDRKEKKLRIVKRSSAKKIDLAVALSMSTAKCLELNL